MPDLKRGLIAVFICVATLVFASATGRAVYGGAAVVAADGGASVFFTWRARGASGSCTGVLIDERAVLTAAHCVRSAGRGDHRVTSVRIGNPAATTLRRRVSTITVHPEFRAANPEQGHDLAVLLLRDAAPGGLAMALPTADDDPHEQGEPLRVYGFGITRAGAPRASSRVLRSISLEHLSPFHCFSGPVAEMATTRMCAASPEAGVCPGDSGSAVVRRVRDRDVLVGIVSLAIDQRTCSSTAAVATRVAPFRAWITTALAGS